MKKVLRRFRYFPIVAPLVFVLFFFGLMPPRFDVIFYTSNIVGEGHCSTYLSSPNEAFAFLYQANAYFGSELQTLRLPELRYDTNKVVLKMYDVEAADVNAIDFSVFGFVVKHTNADGTTKTFRRDVRGAVRSTESTLVHLDFADPVEGRSITLDGDSFIPIWVWICYWTLLLLVALALSLCFGALAERVGAIRLPALGGASIIAAMVLGCFLCGSLPYVDYTYFLLNLLLLLAAALALSALTLPWIGPAVVSVLTLGWYIANHYVISFRGKPIMPADLKAARTAMEVARGYNLRVSWQMLLGIVIVCAYCAGLILLYVHGKKKAEKAKRKTGLIKRGVSLVIAAAVAAVCVNNAAFRSLNSFQWNQHLTEAFHREGIVLTYVKAAMSSHVRRPEGYSSETVDAWLAEYEAQRAVTPEGIRPVNIIMVMNEAFSDLRTVGMDEDIDVMPFIDSLKDNVVEGSLYASIFGGGTCNTEFEALTGNSLAFFGTGAYPYTENVTSPMFSLASYFREQAYKTEAFHANEPQNWNRNMVYPFLGFDAFHSIDDYPELTADLIVHRLPGDLADYLYMEAVSSEYRGQPRFLFDVTMQNHSGYEQFFDLEEAEVVKEYGAELATAARVYLSLVKVSDDAVRQLVETYRDSEEPTMIIFFGDHQPGLRGDEQAGIYNALDYALDYYKTKFFIWTNYETEAQHDVAISANFLPWLILERANFPLPPYVQMLKEVHEKYPIISAMGVVDAEGNVYSGVADLMDDPLMRKYQYVQYANVFDEIDPQWFRAG